MYELQGSKNALAALKCTAFLHWLAYHMLYYSQVRFVNQNDPFSLKLVTFFV